MARILIVDDNAMVRRICREMLAALGHDPIEAEDSAAAVDLYRRERPDAVLMDVNLGLGPDGLEVAEQIAGIDPAVRIAMLTGERHSAVAGAAVHVGAREYILKPFTLDDLRGALEGLLA